MRKPYQKPVLTASPDVKVAPPVISKLAIFLISLIVRPYIIFLFGFAKLELHGDSILFDVFRRSLSGKSRSIIAFRHPDGREPQLLSWLFTFKLKSLALKKKIKFDRKPHSIFVYGYEVARWGGPVVRIVMPKMGAIPIHHTKLDSKGMTKILNSITDGCYPLSLAPEGQVSYSQDTVPRLESGAIRIGFQAASALAAKNSGCPLELLPLSVHFRYGSFGEAAMQRLLKKIEKTCGFIKKESKKLSFDTRIKRCRDLILEINENRYGIKIDDSLSFKERLDKVINCALSCSERMLGIKSEGDFFIRLYKVRHICWDKIYLAGIDSFKKTAGVRRSVMDLQAGEAYYIARHQELADFGWYFKEANIQEDCALHNKVEYVQNLWDFANRTMGGALANRVNIHPRKIIIKTAPAIDLGTRLEHYKENKREAVASVSADLEKAFLDCINEVNNSVSG
ncbi:MAG: acyltransferase [Treponema sp.]|nr:acyltransferase [Treponema sp.]